MTINRLDLELLRRDMIGAAIVMFTGVLAGAYAWWLFDEAREQRENDIYAVSNKRVEVRQLRDDLETARREYPGYEKLANAGMIGDFQKARELDRFEQALQGHGITVRGFALGTLQPVAVPNQSDFRQFQPGRYQLTFSAQVLHELQFGQLVAAVQSSLDEVGTLESCSLSRDANSANRQAKAGSAPTLNARCTLSWYVLTPMQMDQMAAGAAPPPLEN